MMNPFKNKLLVLNKHAGPTSFDVVDAVRRATGIRKVGHTGTLDPLARGLLLVCTGKATRAVEQFMDLPKTYEFTVRLGEETATLDAEGEVIAEAPVPDIAEGEIAQTAASFVGRYDMRPPAYSAIKKNGKRLYELARAGEDAVVDAREVTIHELEVIRTSLPDIDFRIRCSRGTYVRSFARDFGLALGLPAHLRTLVRTSVGPFSIENAFPCERLFAGDVEGLDGIPLVEALGFLPGIVLSVEAQRGLLDGVLPRYEDIVRVIGDVSGSPTARILGETSELLAIGRLAAALRPGLSYVDSFRLFVDRGSVPK